MATSYTFRPAKRENVFLLIGMAGGTGSGKTYSAMSMASGMVGKGERFAVIDTENGRASHYADQFAFDVCDLRAPFTPDAYAEAIEAAAKAGYKVIVVDSTSHVWAGEGGVLDWQETELDRMAGDNWSKREACKMAAWIKPKMAHKRMVQTLLQVNAHIILCFRAEPKVEMVKREGRWVIEPKQTLTGLDGWVPITEKNLPFELTVSFLLTADAPGMPKPIKLQEQHKPIFPLDRPLNAESGRLAAEWARGGQQAVVTPPTPKGKFNATKAIANFAAYDITREQLEARLGHAVSESDRDTLRAWGQSLVDGEPWPQSMDTAQVRHSVSGDPPAAQAAADEGF